MAMRLQLAGVLHLEPCRMEVKLRGPLVQSRLMVVERGAAGVPGVPRVLGEPARGRRPASRLGSPILGRPAALLGAVGSRFLGRLHHARILRSADVPTDDVHRPRICGTIAPVDNAAPITVIEHSRLVRADSERIGRAFTETRRRVRDGRRIALEMTTAAADRKAPQHPVMTARLERLSLAMGRSPLIEQAKGLLAERYGISRGEAFELLASISSHSNRKLHTVAEHVVADQRPRGAKTASSPR